MTGIGKAVDSVANMVTPVLTEKAKSHIMNATDPLPNEDNAAQTGGATGAQHVSFDSASCRTAQRRCVFLHIRRVKRKMPASFPPPDDAGLPDRLGDGRLVGSCAYKTKRKEGTEP